MILSLLSPAVGTKFRYSRLSTIPQREESSVTVTHSARPECPYETSLITRLAYNVRVASCCGFRAPFPLRPLSGRNYSAERISQRSDTNP